MKIILSGYEGSKKIIPASSYLFNKYTGWFDIVYVNYGKYSGKIFIGKYVSLGDTQASKDSWSEDIVKYLKKIRDKYVVFGLDDFLINSYSFGHLIPMNDCVNLHTEFDIHNKMYSCTAQLTLWRKELLIKILSLVKTPWEFELEGSKYINQNNIQVDHVPVFDYCGESALSSRHPNKVSVKGLNKEDIEELISLKLLNRDELIIGQPVGKEIKYEG